MLNFAKNMELYQVFAKIMQVCYVLPEIWSYVKFCQKYGIISSFAKNMELFEILPNLLNYVKFFQKC